jgi:hypothetical protein
LQPDHDLLAIASYLVSRKSYAFLIYYNLTSASLMSLRLYLVSTSHMTYKSLGFKCESCLVALTYKLVGKRAKKVT